MALADDTRFNYPRDTQNVAFSALHVRFARPLGCYHLFLSASPSPSPLKVEWFCFPQGLFLKSSVSQPTPHMSFFVRFTSGVRSYGICLTFYREVAVSTDQTEGLMSTFFRAGA